tara:strand:+ start:5129 stop:5947 length:819 start_codon:yes stop_codon:yes gene_type:complete
MTEFFIVLGVVVLSSALRSFEHRLLRKLGALGILVASFLAFYLPTESIAAGVGGMLIWFMLPWVELLTRVRKLRLPMTRQLEKQPPPGHSRFPSLTELTDEVEEEGFEYVADTGWDWDEMYQFYRLFVHEEEKAEASICLTEQEGVGWVSLSLTSRLEDGRIFRTTNVPFSSPMKSTPEVLTKQVPNAESFEELLSSHRAWLVAHEVDEKSLVMDAPEGISELIEKETGRQIRHNLEAGLIRLGETAETVRYSWRGLFYLYFQLVKDMVKMC